MGSLRALPIFRESIQTRRHEPTMGGIEDIFEDLFENIGRRRQGQGGRRDPSHDQGGQGHGGADQQYCAKCGARATPDTAFCSQCGARLASTNVARVCSACGRELEPGAKFCPACGQNTGS